MRAAIASRDEDERTREGERWKEREKVREKTSTFFFFFFRLRSLINSPAIKSISSSLPPLLTLSFSILLCASTVSLSP